MGQSYQQTRDQQTAWTDPVESLPDYGSNTDCGPLPPTGTGSETPYLDAAGSTEAAVDWDLGPDPEVCTQPVSGGGPAPSLDPALARFAAERFRATGFRPSTGLGQFDVAYAPADGVLTATVNLEVGFIGEWSAEEQEHYAAEMRYTIESLWNSSPAPIRCVKPGWEQFVVTPRILANTYVEGSSSQDPDYRVTVQRGDRGRGIDGYRPPVSTPGYGMPGRLSLDQHQVEDHDAGSFPNDAELARVNQVLAASPVHAEDHGDGWQLDPDSLNLLPELGRAIAPEMPSTPPVPITIEAWEGDGGAQVTTEAAAALHAVGPPNEIEDGFTSPANLVGQITFQADRHKQYTNLHTAVNTLDHEFGHMLGLGDEDASADDEGHGLTEEQNQLTQQSGADQHTVNEDTTSVMSMGKDVLPAHYVTLWEALTKLTAAYVAPADWRL